MGAKEWKRQSNEAAEAVFQKHHQKALDAWYAPFERRYRERLEAHRAADRAADRAEYEANR